MWILETSPDSRRCSPGRESLATERHEPVGGLSCVLVVFCGGVVAGGSQPQLVLLADQPRASNVQLCKL